MGGRGRREAVGAGERARGGGGLPSGGARGIMGGKKSVYIAGWGADGINIYDISRLAGVSIATVSRVINGSDRVSDRTRQRVLRVMEENGYTPNAFARGLGLNTMRLIGLLCADAADPYLAKAVSRLEQGLRQRGYDSLLCCTGYALQSKEKALSLMLSKRVDGLVLVGSHFVEREPEANAYIRRAAERTPVMLLGGELEGENLYTVRCDERAAMRQATRRLLRSGRRRVLFLYNSPSYSGINKLAGYQEGCALEGFAAAASSAAGTGLVMRMDDYVFDIEQVFSALSRRWERGLRFDAVLAADDRLAVGALKFAKARGLRVPEDLSIIGCNDSPFARYCDPELTSIDNRLESLCNQCVSGLMSILAGACAPACTVLGARLVERASTNLALPPKAKEDRT